MKSTLEFRCLTSKMEMKLCALSAHNSLNNPIWVLGIQNFIGFFGVVFPIQNEIANFLKHSITAFHLCGIYIIMAVLGKVNVLF